MCRCGCGKAFKNTHVRVGSVQSERYCAQSVRVCPNWLCTNTLISFNIADSMQKTVVSQLTLKNLILCWMKFLEIKGNKISKRPSILFPSSSQCQKWQQKITPYLNLYCKFKQGVIFCCPFWHRLEDENKIEGLFEILLPLPIP